MQEMQAQLKFQLSLSYVPLIVHCQECGEETQMEKLPVFRPLVTPALLNLMA